MFRHTLVGALLLFCVGLNAHADSSLVTDNFTRANSADLGTAWDEVTGDENAGGFDLDTNQARPAVTSNDSSETNNGTVWPNDQYSQVTHAATSADGVGVGAGPTCRATGGATKTMYRLIGNASGYEFMKFVAGTGSVLSSGSGTTFTSADTMRLRCITSGGNMAWSLQKNTVTFASGTDSSSPIASGKAGIAHSSTSGTAYLSAWDGGSAADAGGATGLPKIFRQLLSNQPAANDDPYHALPRVANAR